MQGRRRVEWMPHDLGCRWSSMLNQLGSVFFMASAIASFTLTTTGEALNIAVVDTGTFLGATCFLVGAYLLLPPSSPRIGT